MAEIKHVGRLTTNNRKLVVAYRVVPGEPENCLVIHTESLEAADHDTLITMVESNAGQTADELSTVMARTQLTDGSNMLARFHQTGKLVKVPTNIVELTPNRTTAIKLDEINQMISQEAPWTLVKNPDTCEKAHIVCSLALQCFACVANYLAPVMPELTLALEDLLHCSLSTQWWTTYTPLWEKEISPYTHLLKRIDPQATQALSS